MGERPAFWWFTIWLKTQNAQPGKSMLGDGELRQSTWGRTGGEQRGPQDPQGPCQPRVRSGMSRASGAEGCLEEIF